METNVFELFHIMGRRRDAEIDCALNFCDAVFAGEVSEPHYLQSQLKGEVATIGADFELGECIYCDSLEIVPALRTDYARCHICDANLRRQGLVMPPFHMGTVSVENVSFSGFLEG